MHEKGATIGELPACGVVLVNTGTPEKPTPSAVGKYLKKFLSDPNVVSSHRLAWWFILRLFVIPRRKRASAQRYETIWTDEGSPIITAHQALAKALEGMFDEEFGNGRVLVRTAMSYGKPTPASVFKEMKRSGVGRLVVVPTYPQAAYSTVRAAEQRVRTTLRRMHWRVPCEFVDNYHRNPSYSKAIAASILHAGFDVEGDDKLLLSFHSIPLEHIEAGDGYEREVGASALAITDELGIDRKRWTLGYQSPFGDANKWLQPYSTDILKRWGEVGTNRVFFACPGFAVDCLETLYDIREDMRPAFEQGCAVGNSHGTFVPVPCLGKTKAHVKVLADVIRPTIKEYFNA